MWPLAIIDLVFGLQKYFWAAKKNYNLQKKSNLQKKHFEKAGWLWPLAIDLVSGPQKYFLAAKHFWFAKNILRKQDGCGPWLLTLCLGRNLSRLVAHAGVAKLDLKSIRYLKKAKRNKKSNDLFLHCHCSNYVSCQNRQTSPKKGEAATKEEATRRGATSWWIFHRNAKYSKDLCSFCLPAAYGPVGLPCLPACLGQNKLPADEQLAGNRLLYIPSASSSSPPGRSWHSASMA